MNRFSNHRGNRGFTIIEALVTLAIAAILLSVTLPVYNNFLDRSRRAQSQLLLLQAANRMEQFYNQHSRYPGDAGRDTSAQQSTTSNLPGDTYFQIVLDPESHATYYRLISHPKGKHRDEECGSLSLDSLGNRSHSGENTNRRCWN